jgi:7-carboxy-7-deazaguanine synthase
MPRLRTEAQNCYENLAFLKPHDEIKFVLKDRHDFDWAQGIIAKHQLFDRVTVLFSCVFGQLDPGELVTWILESGGRGRLQMQLHKFIWPPETRGV